MFAVPDNTVLPRPRAALDPSAQLGPAIPSTQRGPADPSTRRGPADPDLLPRPLPLAALVRAVLAAPPTPGHPRPLGPGGTAWATTLAPGQSVATAYSAPQGAFAVLTGVVQEHSAGAIRDLGPGQIRVFGPGYAHQVHNPGPHPVLAVHLQLTP